MGLARSGCYLFGADINLNNQGVELSVDKDSEKDEGVLPTLALLMAGDICGAIRRAQVACNHFSCSIPDVFLLILKTILNTSHLPRLLFMHHPALLLPGQC